ncbi:hypothetical protein GUJ93_ZPchr0015g6819 [Zizania palustris]|uniref:Uncharacterized protein n=1 Tax=Zizania palustris TaxID=103762 RepID=A0A8J5T8W2_ZIZPA|nr:hypothetical protein GUJ93_ZPchr0015g6819 [Zizania palustris]
MLVMLANNTKVSRLDNWRLSWEWWHDEFIYSMKDAYLWEKDISGYIYGSVGQYYLSLDFSQVLNCYKKPMIM